MARKSGVSGADTARAIRAAALKLIARHGYAAVSMRQIAKEVGVQAGALYLYVPDKQSLLMELMEGHMTALLAAWDAAEKETPDPLAAFVRFHLDYHLDRRDEVFIAYMELRNLEPENFARIEGLRRDYESILRGILEARGTTDANVETRALIAMLTGVTNWYDEGGPLSRDALIARYQEMAKGVVE
ncbi:TetR/AcrR family transcriptional regulator [Paracoccaceae bacterium GXU_MW_L88]